VVVVGVVAVFAIYTWGWRDNDREADREAVLARAYAITVAEVWDLGIRGDVRRVASGLWIVQMGERCFLIDIEKYEDLANQRFRGVSLADCGEGGGS
jgi:hypothetical protein